MDWKLLYKGRDKNNNKKELPLSRKNLFLLQPFMWNFFFSERTRKTIIQSPLYYRLAYLFTIFLVVSFFNGFFFSSFFFYILM